MKTMSMSRFRYREYRKIISKARILSRVLKLNMKGSEAKNSCILLRIRCVASLNYRKIMQMNKVLNNMNKIKMSIDMIMIILMDGFLF